MTHTLQSAARFYALHLRLPPMEKSQEEAMQAREQPFWSAVSREQYRIAQDRAKRQERLIGEGALG